MLQKQRRTRLTKFVTSVVSVLACLFVFRAMSPNSTYLTAVIALGATTAFLVGAAAWRQLSAK